MNSPTPNDHPPIPASEILIHSTSRFIAEQLIEECEHYHQNIKEQTSLISLSKEDNDLCIASSAIFDIAELVTDKDNNCSFCSECIYDSSV